MDPQEVSVNLSAVVDLADTEKITRIGEAFARLAMGLALEGINTHMSYNPLLEVSPDED